MARVSVLGPVELLDPGGAPAPLSPRTRRLLAALAVRAGTVAPVDWLAAAVWGDEVPEHPGNALQTLVSRLRASIRTAGGGPELLTRPEGYVLRADTDALDAATFRGLVTRARAARQVEDRMTALADALALWRGPAYGLLADEVVARDEAVALTELRLAATTELADAELTAGQAGAAQERLTAVVAERPYDERPALLLMQTLASMGRVGDALAVYADLRRRLRDDLGLEPTSAAAAAQRTLLRAETSLPAVGLPLPGDVLGRAEDERALAALLTGASGAPRLVTVLGPGGVGKTTLAARVARLVTAEYADGALAVELGRLDAGEDVALAACTALGLPAGQGSPTRRLVGALRDRELLLVLDSCEHLVTETARLVDRLGAGCPGVRVLATSRVSLRSSDERVVRLQPLAEDAAVELYCRRARQRLGDFAPALDELSTIAELCRRLDHLPLAIELAAGRADVITAAELLDRWSWHRSMLRGRSGGDPRHRSLTALVDWSYERLPTDAQRVFEVAGVFAGDFSLGDAAELWERLGQSDDPAGALATLVDSSMISRSPATGRFRVLETVRAYGRARLTERGVWDAVAATHAELFADRATAGRVQLYGAGQPAEIRRLLTTVDELRAAFGWTRTSRPDLAVRLVGGAALLVEQTLSGETVAWADALVGGPDGRDGFSGVDGSSGGDGPGASDPWVCAVAAAGARFVGDLERAAALADRAIALAGDDILCRSYAVLVRSDVALFAGDAATVAACLAQASEPTRPMVQLNALLIRQYAGAAVDPVAARTIRTTAERQGRAVVAAWACYVEGELLLGPDPGGAHSLLTTAVDRARALGDEYLAGVALVSAASAAQRSGRLVQARTLFAEVVRHWQVRGDRTHQWTTLRNVVELLAAIGQSREALVLGTALLVPERHAAGYGQDAARLIATVDRLLAGSPPDAAGSATDRGHELRDDQVVSLALSVLAGPDPGTDPTAQDSR